MADFGESFGSTIADPAGIFKKKAAPTYDPTKANQLAQKGETSENAFINQFSTGTAANQNTLQNSVAAAKAAADTQSRGAAQDYLSNYDPITSRLVQSRTDQLKQQLFGQIPELTQAAREAGAAGGGLDRGVTQNTLAGIPEAQGKAFNTGATDLANTALTGQLDARGKVFDSQNQLILNKLGIDSQTAESIMSSGNQALIQQLNDLIDNSRNSIGIQLSADNAAQGSSTGAAQNSNANQQATINGLLGLAGTAVGGIYGGPAGAAVGGQAGKAIGGALSTSTSNASTTKNA